MVRTSTGAKVAVKGWSTLEDFDLAGAQAATVVASNTIARVV